MHIHPVVTAVLDEPAAAGAPARVWRDWVLVAVLAPAIVLESVLRRDVAMAPAWTVAVVLLLPTLLWRRTHPLRMVALAFATTGILTVIVREPVELVSTAYLLVLLYALVRWGAGRDVLLGSGVLLAHALLTAWVDHEPLADAAGGLVILVATGALGLALRFRARSASRALEQVRLVEREHLARDLHDTVAHHVSAIAIRAQAGLLAAATSPAAPVDALRVIEGEASRALAEMRSMVRVLRHDDPVDLAPRKGLGDLEELATAMPDGVGGGSPAVVVEAVGLLDDVAPAVGAAVYRMAQESVTNARRHARDATTVLVRVRAEDRTVHLVVHDDGDTPHRVTHPGYGLTGMAERAHLLGGTFEAGPDPAGGWTVTAALPRTGPLR